ncbi:spore photoproduct lyase [Natranaerovirga pectinivora]|uniref:Spore photoproduct lyase n=1 Tax=Natranaerovirga pectinivora TaxID=682400 RepID=A0A4R3MQS9_9FIRM|nr:spore photoproduct lyase [Natranaerovirga pectinivora]TCT16266.1 spore photoproduct lyase [Natranaerovirga pectinivora]
MKTFIPDLAYIDPKILKTQKGIEVRDKLESLGVPLIESRSVKIDEGTIQQKYIQSKKVIYVTANNQKKLQQCQPSADYMFHLSSSCPAHCEYCYLQTTQGEKPFLKLFVNVEDIIHVLEDYMKLKAPDITSFECGSITDPIALEHLTGNLKEVIEFFGKSDLGRLRVISKYDNVDSFLDIKHNDHTKFRFSINARYVISSFEHGTANFDERIIAASKIADAGYPLGFIIAPIMVFEGWKEQYDFLLQQLSYKLRNYKKEISFELIQHRYTQTAKDLILERFPNTKLDMTDENRQLKWGPYGKFKYVYPKDTSGEMKDHIIGSINKYFNNAHIEYFT